MKKLVIILAVAAVVTGAIATNQWLDLRVERRQAAEIAIRQAAAESMQRAPVAVPQAPAPAMPVVAVTSPKTVAAPAAIASTPASKQSAAQAADSPMKAMLEAMATPESQDATRGRLTRRYPDIEQQLGITSQEKQKLFDLLVQQEQEEDQQFPGMMLAMQDPAAARDMQRKMVEVERAQEAKVSALLGSRYPTWEEYQGTVAARQEVDQLRTTLGASENPLSESQSQQLVAAFAVEKRRANKDDREWNQSSAAINSPNLMKETMQREEDSRKRLVDVASPILNIAQLNRYKQKMEQEATMMRAAAEMMTGGGKP